jgi:hypothetical protein
MHINMNTLYASFVFVEKGGKRGGSWKTFPGPFKRMISKRGKSA